MADSVKNYEHQPDVPESLDLHHLVKDPSVNIQDEISLAVTQLENQIKAVKHGPSAADMHVHHYFQ